MIDCVDLEKEFGHKYRIQFEANGKTRSGIPDSERKWLLELVCKYGLIYPIGRDILAAFIPEHTGLFNKMCQLPNVHSNGLEEIRFPVSMMKPILKIMKPVRIREISPERLAQLKRNVERARQVRLGE